MDIKFYFPRWFFPNNIGDSVNTTFIPKILKKIYPNSRLEVITQGFLIDIFRLDPNVDVVREPNSEEKYLNFRGYSISENQKEDIKIIYPEWHPNVFNFWGNHHDFLVGHPTVNLITLNYLLQLKMENLIFDDDFDFSEIFYVENKRTVSQKINIGIVPATKLAGRPTPHPGCDGKGLRFNGENGIESWSKFVNKLKELNQNICIYEFSNENFGLGDVHYPHTNDFLELINQVDNMDLGVMSDGGIHHVFNARKKPVVLFQATKVNKCEFFKLENSFFPEDLHLDCRKKCRSYFSEVLKIDDMSKTCNLECESLDPVKLAIYTNDVINNNILNNK